MVVLTLEDQVIWNDREVEVEKIMNIKDLMYEIKLRIPIEDVIGRYISLKRVGKNYVALCPFHRERTPSFTVAPDKGFYHCFGCGKSGDIFTFVMEIEKISFMEALRKLGKECGVDIDIALGGKSRPDKLLASNLKQLNIEAQKFFVTYLTKLDKSKEGLNYLRSRGINSKTAEKFKFGMAPNSKNNLYKFLKSKFFTDETIFESRLVINTPSGPLDLFRHRLTFPIESEYGEIVGFAGRALSPDDPAKYINLPETPIFRKRNILFGFNHAKGKIKETKRVFLVEGYFDTISLHKCGIENVCGVMGTALTLEQLRLVNNIAQKVYLFFDSDSAGVKAVERAVQLILNNTDLEVEVIRVSQKDPDEFVRLYEAEGKTLDETTLLKHSLGVIDFFLLQKDSFSPEGDKESKMSFILRMFYLISLMKNVYDKEENIKKIAEAMKLSESLLRAEFEKYQNRQKVSADNINLSYSKLPSTDIELIMSYMISKNNSLLDTLKAEIDIKEMKNDTVKTYLSFLDEYLASENVSEEQVNTLHLLQSEIENASAGITKTFGESMKEDFEFLLALYRIKKIKERKKEIQSIIEKVIRESEETELIEELLEEKQSLSIEEKKIKESRGIAY